MRNQAKIIENVIKILFISFIIFTSGFLVSLLIIPFLHPEVNIPHLQIYIDEDADFNKYNFPGSGTEEDPFLIENFTYKEHGLIQIRIFGVSKYFVIRNNIILSENFEERISIGNVPDNISILNNVLYGSAHKYDWVEGIRIYNSNKCNIINNSVFSIEKGIHVLSSSDCIIKNNKLIKNGRNIEIYNSTNIAIENNSLIFDEKQTRYSTMESVYIKDSLNVSVKYNQFYKSGLYFADNSISTAIIQDNFINDLKIGFFHNENNVIINSTEEFGQIFMANCSNCSIYNINITNCNIGIAIYNSTDINCSFCDLSFNFYTGLYLFKGVNITFQNSFYFNNYIGTRIKYSDLIQFLNNTFQENSYGVYLSNSNCTYVNNSFIDNTIEDIEIYNY